MKGYLDFNVIFKTEKYFANSSKVNLKLLKKTKQISSLKYTNQTTYRIAFLSAISTTLLILYITQLSSSFSANTSAQSTSAWQ